MSLRSCSSIITSKFNCSIFIAWLLCINIAVVIDSAIIDIGSSSSSSLESIFRQKRDIDLDFIDDDFSGIGNRKRFGGISGSSNIINKIPSSVSTGGATIIEMDELDPRRQTVSSSYSIVETSKGPNTVTVTRTDRQYEPKQQTITSQFSPTPQLSQRSKLIGEDDRKSRRMKFPVAGKENKLPSAIVVERKDLDSALSEEEETLKKLNNKKTTTNPNSIKDIVEEKDHHHRPSTAGSSSRGSIVAASGDLKNDGSLLGSGSVEEGYEGAYDKEKHYDKEAGKKYVQAHKAESGEEADKAYKKEKVYDAAEKEKHGKEHKKAAIKEEEGEKKAHLDQAKHYEEDYKNREGERGKSVLTKGGHKKGHKKTGFHKVHHKDEYKKDEVFYDEAHDDAEKEEHAHEHEKHAKEKGSAEKAGHIDSGYHKGHSEKKAYEDKGQNYDVATGHHKEAAKEAVHDEHSKYGKKKGIKEGKKYGHSEAGKAEGGYYENDGDDHF